MSRLIVIVLFLCLSSAPIQTDDDRPDDIEFHSAAFSFPCREKTPKEFAEVNPDRKIIETSIRVSANFNIAEGAVDRIEYRLKMPDAFEISDYLPKTTVGSEIAGPIGVGRQDSSKSLTVVSLDAGAKAGFKIPQVADVEARASAGRKDDGAKEIGSSVQMNLLPPKQLITSASTQNAGRTLHFKLKQFNQITLEGDKDFAFLANVPRDWKGDCFMLECTTFLKGSQNIAVRKGLMLGLYINGDLVTKKQVEDRAKTYRSAMPTGARTTVPAPAQEVAPGLRPADSDPFRHKYSGKYSIYIAFGVTLHVDLLPDGTWTARGISSITGATSQSRGVWSATDEIMKITCKHEKCSLYDLDTNTDIINSKISVFDAGRRIIRTESNHELKGE